MESQEIISEIRKQLDQVEAIGHAQVQVAGLRLYLSALEKDASASIEHRKQQHAGMLAEHSAMVQQSLEMFKAVTEAGRSALHSIVIINGGAVVALLGVMANLAGKESGKVFGGYLALPLLEFGLGVLCGGLGFAFRYFSQACYSEATRAEATRYSAWGDRFRYCAITSAVAGYVFFGFAMLNAYNAVVWAFSL